MFLGQIERHFDRLRRGEAAPVAKPVAPPPLPAKPPPTASDVPASATEEVPECTYKPPPKEPKPLPDLKYIEYASPLLRAYGWAYSRDLREIAMSGTEGKKITAPMAAPLYERMATYLAKHKGEEGYPQTQREFVILAVEHLLVDLDAEARDDESESPVEPAANCPLADGAQSEQLAG